jgi:hypothetical protein
VSAAATGIDTLVELERLEALAYEIPVDGPGGVESDGTLEWSSTTLVVVLVHAGGECGLGYTYAPAACAKLVADELAGPLAGEDLLAVGERTRALWA